MVAVSLATILPLNRQEPPRRMLCFSHTLKVFELDDYLSNPNPSPTLPFRFHRKGRGQKRFWL